MIIWFRFTSEDKSASYFILDINIQGNGIRNFQIHAYQMSSNANIDMKIMFIGESAEQISIMMKRFNHEWVES